MTNAAEHTKPTQAQTSLMSALEALLCEKPLASIDVKRLCSRAHVARSTFYAYYRNVDDLMEQLENAHVEKLRGLNEWIVTEKSLDAKSVRAYGPTLQYISDNAEFFYAELALHHNGRLSEKWKNAIKSHLARRFGNTAHATKRFEFAIEVVSSAVISACVYWLKNPDAMSEEDVFVMLERVFGLLASDID